MTDIAGVVWRKSRRSQANGACVEVARLERVIGIRDSKDVVGPVLTIAPGAFAAFLAETAKGGFDRA